MLSKKDFAFPEMLHSSQFFSDLVLLAETQKTKKATQINSNRL